MAALDVNEEERMERLLRVGTCLAMCGYGAQVGQLAATARAFRADAQLWGAHAPDACCTDWRRVYDPIFT